MKVLLPIDSSYDAKLISDMVVNFRWPPGSEFVLIHVMDPNQLSEKKLDEENVEQLLTESSLYLKKHLPQCRFENRLMHGAASTEILSFAKLWQANMIVLGWRALSQSNHSLAGSVSRAVGLESPCSVTIVRPPSPVPLVTEKLQPMGQANIQ